MGLAYVERRSQEPAFFTREGHEDQRAWKAAAVGDSCPRDLDDRCSAGRVVVRAIVNLSCPPRHGESAAETDVIVVRADHDGLVRARRVVAWEYANHVADS